MKTDGISVDGFDDPTDIVDGMSPEQINRQMAAQLAQDAADNAPSPTTPSADPAPARLDIGVLLGGAQEPAGEPQAPAKPDAPAAPPAASEPTETALQARVRELAERNSKLEATNMQLVERVLGASALPPPAGATDEIPPGMAPETYEYLKPLIEPLKAKIRELEGHLAPIRQRSGNDELTAHLVANVEGFTADMMPQLREVFDGLSPAEQQAYGRDGVSAEGLAQRIVRRAGGGAPRPAVPDHRSRLQGDLGGGAQQATLPKDGSAAALQKLMQMPDDEFERTMRSVDSSLLG